MAEVPPGWAELPRGWLRCGPRPRPRASQYSRSRLTEVLEMSAKTKDPSGGTTGRVKPYGALGVDGRSRRIQPRWGGITAPTNIGRGTVAARSNHRRFFLGFFWRALRYGSTRRPAYGAATARLTIFSPCSLLIRPAI